MDREHGQEQQQQQQDQLNAAWARHAALQPRDVKGKGQTGNHRQSHCHGHVNLVSIRSDLSNGRGLALTQDIAPNELVLTLPASMLINTKTIAPDFDIGDVPRPGPGKRGKLTAIQALCLWLCRSSTRDVEPARERDRAAFLESLPRTFVTHPVMWALNEDEQSELLLACLPHETARRVAAQVEQLQEDWKAVRSYCQAAPAVASSSSSSSAASHSPSAQRLPSKQSFVHSWLCISTRSVYYPLGLASRGDNLTLAPILDMANHTPHPRQAATVSIVGAPTPSLSGASSSSSESTSLAPIPGAGRIEVRLPLGGRKGDEVCITYGPHDDSRLLAEYGFHLAATPPPTAQRRGEGPTISPNPHGSVDLTPFLERSLTSLAQTEGGCDWREQLLRSTGYWGDWTLHPSPVGPSWRTWMVCRLLASRPPTQAEREEVERRFDLLVSGRVELISRENEEGARKVLSVVCGEARAELEGKVGRLEEAERLDVEYGEERDGKDRRMCRGLVRNLLLSQIAILSQHIEHREGQDGSPP